MTFARRKSAQSQEAGLRPCAGPPHRTGVEQHTVSSSSRPVGWREGACVHSKTIMALGYSQRAQASRDVGLSSILN